MHFADVPGHILRWASHVEPFRQAMAMHRVDVINPKRHQSALVARLVAFHLKCGGVWPFTATALRPLAKKNLHIATSHGAESCRRAPLPPFSPAPLREPGKTGVDASDV